MSAPRLPDGSLNEEEIQDEMITAYWGSGWDDLHMLVETYSEGATAEEHNAILEFADLAMEPDGEHGQ